MKTKHIFIIFIIVAFAQLFVPAQMIFNRESILENGRAYKFKTQPIDPSDPFRGKYIILNYDMRSFLTNDSLWQRQEEVYIYIDNDSLGFAEINQISRIRLDSDKDYVKVKVDWYDAYSHEVNIDLPFNRFYMEETKAYDAEVAHREAQQDSLPNNTYALVYIKDGEAVLENVFINDIPIANYVDD